MIRMMSGGDELEKLEHELREFSADSAVSELVNEVHDEKEDEDRLAPLKPEVMKRSNEIEDDNS